MARRDKGVERKYRRHLDRHIGSTIMNIGVDDTMPKLSNEMIEETHAKYGIRTYKNQRDFVMNYFKTSTGKEMLEAWGYRSERAQEEVLEEIEEASPDPSVLTPVDVADWISKNNPNAVRLWNEYSHREDLIRTGQYETARNRQYVENLLKKYDMALSYSEFSTHLDADTLAKVRALRDTLRNMTDDEIVNFLDASKDKGIDNARASRLPYIIDSDPRTINEGNDEMDNIIQVLKDAGIKIGQQELDVEEVYGRKEESVKRRRRAYKGDYERAFEILSYRMPPTIYKPSHHYSDKELLRWGDAMPKTRDGRVAFFPKSLNDRYFELKNRE